MSLSKLHSPQVVFCPDEEAAAKAAAREIAEVIRERHASGGAVLGLATGATQIKVYDELVRMHLEEGLDLSRVKTFNLDEYQGLSPFDEQSYWRYMHQQLFSRLTVLERAIRPRNTHLPKGDLSHHQVGAHAQAYEELIRKAGGLDLQLLGIGRDGHVGFNEPGSEFNTQTRLVQLDEVTQSDAAKDFPPDQVPSQAITMGVATILSARRLVLVATGENKREIIARALTGKVGPEVPASFLRTHPDLRVYLDPAAGAGLSGAQA